MMYSSSSRKKLINAFWFSSGQMWGCWSLSQTLNQCLNCCFIIYFGDLGTLLHEPSCKVPQWLPIFLLAVVQIWWLSCCFVKYLECLDKLCLKINPNADWVWL
jgi:hypothetical protein